MHPDVHVQILDFIWHHLSLILKNYVPQNKLKDNTEHLSWVSFDNFNIAFF
jgi:hypothetical protein